MSVFGRQDCCFDECIWQAGLYSSTYEWPVPYILTPCMTMVGQNYIWIWCVYGYFSRETIKYTFKYGAFRRFWPTVCYVTMYVWRLPAETTAHAWFKTCLVYFVHVFFFLFPRTRLYNAHTNTMVMQLTINVRTLNLAVSPFWARSWLYALPRPKTKERGPQELDSPWLLYQTQPSLCVLMECCTSVKQIQSTHISCIQIASSSTCFCQYFSPVQRG